MIAALRRDRESTRSGRERATVARQTRTEGRSSEPAPGFTLSQAEGGTLVLRLSGDWKLKGGLPTPGAVEKQFDLSAQPRRLTFDTTELGGWDSGLLAFLAGLQELCQAASSSSTRPTFRKARGVC
jgi:hypothetical protein